jgi:hypothetical protein
MLEIENVVDELELLLELELELSVVVELDELSVVDEELSLLDELSSDSDELSSCLIIVSSSDKWNVAFKPVET